MAIRDRFRRALRKSTSTGHSIRHTDTGLTTDSNTSTDSSEFSSLSPRRTSFFSKLWSTRRSSRTVFGDGANEDHSDKSGAPSPHQIGLALTRTASEAEREMKAEKKRQRKAKYKNGSAGTIHPRDKPLTAQNLRHQAMLGTWSWDEAAGKSRHSWVSGISPCCTRAPSLYEYDPHETSGGDDFFDNGGSSTAHGITNGSREF